MIGIKVKNEGWADSFLKKKIEKKIKTKPKKELISLKYFLYFIFFL